MEYNIGHRPLRAVPLHIRHLVTQTAIDAHGDSRPSPPVFPSSSSSSSSPPAPAAALPPVRRVISDGEEMIISVPTDRLPVSTASTTATRLLHRESLPSPPESPSPAAHRVVTITNIVDDHGPSSAPTPASVPANVVGCRISDDSLTDRSMAADSGPPSVSPPAHVVTAPHVRRVIQKLPLPAPRVRPDPTPTTSSPPPSSSPARHVVSDVSGWGLKTPSMTADRPLVPATPLVGGPLLSAPAAAAPAAPRPHARPRIAGGRTSVDTASAVPAVQFPHTRPRTAGVLAPLPSDDADDSDDDARSGDDDDEPVPLVSDSEDDDVSAAATPATARSAPAPLPPVRGARCENPGKECDCTRCIYARTRATGDSTTCPSIDCKCYGCRSARRPRPPPSPKRRA
jgi:hypothetical protein